MLTKSLMICSVIALCAGAVRADAADESAVRKERVDSFFKREFEAGGFAFMSCAIDQHGEKKYTFHTSTDNADARKRSRMKDFSGNFSADTPLKVASVTKIVTSVLIIQLCEDGLITLRDPVKKYIPMFPDEKVQIIHLMTHTSGWRNKSGHSRDPKRAEKFYTTLFKEAEIEERFNYMSQGYDILAEIIERVTGFDDVAEVAAKRVFIPLEMKHTTFSSHQGQTGMCTTAGDMLKFGRHLLDVRKTRKTGILSAPGVDTLMRPVLKGEFFRTPGFFIKSGRIGFSQYFADLNSPSAVGHAGATGCYLLLDPELDTVQVILSDGSDLQYRGFDQNFSRMNAVLISNFTDTAAPLRERKQVR